MLLTDFRRRLEELVSYAERVGAMPVLILPPANDAGFEPNRSFLPPTTPRAERDAFGREFLAASKLETVNPAAAIERYRALIARQPCFAETHYRLAHLLEQAGAWDEAYREYVAARDLDGMPMRCLSPFQEAYREVAARHGCILIDGQTYFHAIGRHGLLDDELFQDAMHPSLRGQIALAQGGPGRTSWTRRAFGWPKDSAVPVVDPAECVAHFGIDKTAWRHDCLVVERVQRADVSHEVRYEPALAKERGGHRGRGQDRRRRGARSGWPAQCGNSGGNPSCRQKPEPAAVRAARYHTLSRGMIISFGSGPLRIEHRQFIKWPQPGFRQRVVVNQNAPLADEEAAVAGHVEVVDGDHIARFD